MSISDHIHNTLYTVPSFADEPLVISSIPVNGDLYVGDLLQLMCEMIHVSPPDSNTVTYIHDGDQVARVSYDAQTSKCWCIKFIKLQERYKCDNCKYTVFYLNITSTRIEDSGMWSCKVPVELHQFPLESQILHINVISK